MNFKLKLLLLLTGILLVLGVEAAPIIEEIIVTAEKREQNLQRVPLPVTAFSNEDFTASEITELYDISVQSPNLTFTSFNIGEPQIYIRGIGTTSDSSASDPTVSVFLDEVYIGRPGASFFDLYDIERVEVLRGPQGTLWGRNVTGGAISIITKKPSENFEAKFGASLGNEGLTVVRGYINGPISNNVAGKLTFAKRDRDGFSKNVTNGQELDDADNLSTRGQLLFTPGDRTELTMGFDYSKDNTNGQCRNHTKFNAPDQNAGGVIIPLIDPIIATAGTQGARK